MLLQAESDILFGYLRTISSLYVFPYTVDQDSGKIHAFGKRKYLLWVALYALLLVNFTHGLWQFVSILVFRKDQIVMYHLPVQFDAVVCSFIFHPVIMTIIQRNRYDIEKIFNELYSSKDEQTVKRPLWKLKFQDLLPLGAGPICVGAIAVYAGLIILMDDMAHLLLNNPMLKMSESCAVARTAIHVLLETPSVSMWILHIGFFWSMGCLVQLKVQLVLATASRKLRYFHYRIFSDKRRGHIQVEIISAGSLLNAGALIGYIAI